MSSSIPRILIYILRRDVRLSDNPIFHAASGLGLKSDTTKSPLPSPGIRERGDPLVSAPGKLSFTHFLPVYIFPADQVEISGFIPSESDHSPYPEARSQIASVWRTGPHRAKFIAEGVWDLKQRLEGLGCGSGLEIRVGMIGDVVRDIVDWYSEEADGGKRGDVADIWMTGEVGTEEKRDEQDVMNLAEEKGIGCKIWDDEKYYIDDNDIPLDDLKDLPNVYTSYRKSLEPLRSRPRPTIPTPSHLPPLPPKTPPQTHPFRIPTALPDLKKALLLPLDADPTFGLASAPHWPPNVRTAHDFEGGESSAQERVKHLITSGAMCSYKDTRNGMLGVDFSTKLSAYLAQGYLTARQVHWAMVDFEEGRGPGKNLEKYGAGENKGTAAVRFELLWRDYMRLCARKFGPRMFYLNGIRDYVAKHEANGDTKHAPRNPQQLPPRKNFRHLDRSGGAGDDPKKTKEVLARFCAGRTGVGLIDASQRELFLTGYTSNRARQNVASFLASHLGIDWRAGAEWYEFLLIDYDVANNWGNWQYVAGVGNDPRQGRIFNPVKQALDYDGQGEYIKAWVPELRGVTITKEAGKNKNKEEVDQQKLMGLYQAWKLGSWEKEDLGLTGVEWVEHPLIRIQFSVGRGKGSDGNGKGRGSTGGRGKNSRGRGKEFRRLGPQDKAELSQGTGFCS